MSEVEGFELIRDRLGRDLRTRFPEIDVRLVRDDDGEIWIRVDGTHESWGDVLLGMEVEGPLTDAEVEVVLSAVATQVTDNSWPEELTDPWPVCSTHPTHPLSPDLRGGRAVWLCGEDGRTNVRIGSLGSG